MRTYYLLVMCIVLESAQDAHAQSPWTHVPSPNPSSVRSLLRGITGTSENDIWAVGSFETTPPGGNYSQDNLIIHWTGSTWTVVPVPAPAGALNFNDLWDVHSVAVNEVWAVGNYAGAGSGSLSQILHYDGSAWNQVNVNVAATTHFLWSLDAISANDVWAVGGQSASVQDPCLAMHYDGSSWTTVPVPAVGQIRNRFVAVDGISSNDVWAVGSWGHSLGTYNYLTMHWDGTDWTPFPVPSSVSGNIGELIDVYMIASNDVWAIGNKTAGGMTLIHWDGMAWNEVIPQGGGGAIAARSANDVYALGEIITRWDGTGWLTQDSLNYLIFPALSAAVVLPSGEIWAAGTAVDFSNIFETLVVRSGTPVGNPEAVALNTADFSVYPNPVTAGSALQIVVPDKGVTKVKMYAPDNKLISEESRMLNAGTNEWTLDLPELPAGIYIMQLESQTMIHTIKVVVHQN